MTLEKVLRANELCMFSECFIESISSIFHDLIFVLHCTIYVRSRFCYLTCVCFLCGRNRNQYYGMKAQIVIQLYLRLVSTRTIPSAFDTSISYLRQFLTKVFLYSTDFKAVISAFKQIFCFHNSNSSSPI